MDADNLIKKLFPLGKPSAPQKAKQAFLRIICQKFAEEPHRRVPGKEILAEMAEEGLTALSTEALSPIAHWLREKLDKHPDLGIELVMPRDDEPRGYRLGRRIPSDPVAPRDPVADPVADFWNLAFTEPTLCVIFGNQCDWLEYYELFTGIGEAAGLFQLGITLGALSGRLTATDFEIWDSHGRTPEPKKGMSYLYVGSTLSNIKLRKKLEDEWPDRVFLFEEDKTSIRKRRAQELRSVPKKPKSQRPETLIRDLRNRKPYRFKDSAGRQFDYVVMAFREQEISSYFWVAGISTFATWAGLRALRSPRFLSDLLSRLEYRMTTFEALVEIPIENGRPLAVGTDTKAKIIDLVPHPLRTQK